MKCAVRILHFDALLGEQGWIEPGYVSLDEDGLVVEVSPQIPANVSVLPLTRIEGWAIPGFQNAHSHAFQYAMAGLAEHLPKGATGDDFWSWREAMYRLALTISPSQLEAVAGMLYAEMLRFGITAVTEFHYLHHDAHGRPYSHLAEMGTRLVAAAERTGIALTLVPIFYQQGGFDKPAEPTQVRFLSPNFTAFQQLVEASEAVCLGRRDIRVGIGVHSLRAVTAPDVMKTFAARGQRPLHIHVAEQQGEVDACLRVLGKRPITWLLDHVELNEGTHLVHATHLDDLELERLARTGAVVVLCPSTEGNLGDGLFPLARYRAAGGRMAIGTDSHIGLSPVEDLRWLDYGQRLFHQKRNTIARTGEDSGELLFRWAYAGGRLAMGETKNSYFAQGSAFDAIVLDPNHPVLFAKPTARRLSAYLYAGDHSAHRMVLRRGVPLVINGRHRDRDVLFAAYAQALKELQNV